MKKEIASIGGRVRFTHVQTKYVYASIEGYDEVQTVSRIWGLMCITVNPTGILIPVLSLVLCYRKELL